MVFDANGFALHPGGILDEAPQNRFPSSGAFQQLAILAVE
jgi:hypothetical protein